MNAPSARAPSTIAVVSSRTAQPHDTCSFKAGLLGIDLGTRCDREAARTRARALKSVPHQLAKTTRPEACPLWDTWKAYSTPSYGVCPAPGVERGAALHPWVQGALLLPIKASRGSPHSRQDLQSHPLRRPSRHSAG